eukprot:CAMPEP_0202693522 /NCGR_PEP_ID=MMETSP1385-20130828/7613_1 /ASSEMBLY_ACC=CAM_ASM_000861 /TAXON_ID=933848 /ORGANISM="Elphidium margaritaceum" /LENGTH=211 /DNA_ID=CAMNT_0049349209 /DNA_START=65 /DNA_END=697 /DNA_ORIENTATION=+
MLGDGNVNCAYSNVTVEERAERLVALEIKLNEMEKSINEQEEKLATAAKEETQTQPNKTKKCSFSCFSTKDIKDKIPRRFTRSVYSMYYLWLFTSLALTINAAAMIIYNFNFNATQDFTHRFVVSVMMALIGIPGGFYGWYRRYFSAIAYRSQTQFLIFNVNFMIHNIFVVVMSVGFTALNSAGILVAAQQIHRAQKGVTEISVIVAALMW